MQTAATIFSGTAVSYQCGILRKQEKVLKENDSVFTAALFQHAQLGALSHTLNALTKLAPTKAWSGRINVLSSRLPLIGVGISLFSTLLLKTESYKIFADFIKELSITPQWVSNLIPSDLSERSVKVLTCIVNHLSDVAFIAHVVSAAALLVVGNAPLGGAMLAGFTYQVLDRCHCIPSKVSAFVDQYMPLLSFGGLLLSGSINKLFYIAFLLWFAFEKCSVLTPQKVVQIARFCFPSIIKDFINPSFSFLEIDKLVETKSLSFSEIQQILQDEDSNYEIVPAHCSKALDFSQLPTNSQFDLFKGLSQALDWQNSYDDILNQLAGKPRFIKFFKKHFKIEERIQKEKLEGHIQKQAVEANMTKQAYMGRWFADHIDKLETALKSQAATESPESVQYGVNLASKALPSLLTLSKSSDEADKKQFLSYLVDLVIASDSGSLKEITKAMEKIVLKEITRQPCSEEDPNFIKIHEKRVLATGELIRRKIIKQNYEHLAEDELIRLNYAFSIEEALFYLTLGFAPIPQHERRQIGIKELAAWVSVSPTREMMVSIYEFKLSVCKAIQDICSNHMNSWLEAHTSLNSQEIEDVKGCKAATTHGKNRNFRRLILVQLGILRKKG